MKMRKAWLHGKHPQVNRHPIDPVFSREIYVMSIFSQPLCQQITNNYSIVWEDILVIDYYKERCICPISVEKYSRAPL